MKRPSLPRGAGWWLGASLPWLASCSLTTFERSPCETSLECRSSFGLGSTCGADGLCSERQVHPRCERSFPDDLLDDPQLARESIVFGSLFDATNVTHQARERSIQLALRQINDEGGLEGRPFGLVACSIEAGLEQPDGTGTTAGTLSAGGHLVNVLGVPAIIGPATSADALALFEELRSTGTFVISPSATSPALTRVDVTEPTDENPGLLWRTAPPDSLQGQVIASDMMSRGVESVAVIAEGGAYGEGLFEIFNQSYGGFVRLSTFRDANQRAQAITSAGASSADEVLFIASSQSDVEIFLASLEANEAYATKGIFLTDSAANRSVLSRTPLDVVPRVRGTRPVQLKDRDFAYGVFRSSYRAEYDDDVAEYNFAAHSYDATWVAMLGAAWAQLSEGEIRGVGIARGARRLTTGEAPTELSPSKWLEVLQIFRDGEGINVVGTSGLLDYDPQTEETSAPIEVWRVVLEDGVPAIAVP